MQQIYVIRSVDRTIVKSCGTGQLGARRALSYAIRRNVLEGYLSMRQGFPPSKTRLKIVARSGRKLAIGASIDAPTHGKYKSGSGWSTRKQGRPAVEILSICPAAELAAQTALEKRYPKTWQRYFHAALF